MFLPTWFGNLVALLYSSVQVKKLQWNEQQGAQQAATQVILAVVNHVVQDHLKGRVSAGQIVAPAAQRPAAA